jgi:hypothetical protein
MKLINSDLRTFIDAFGIEGVRLVEAFNVDIYMLDDATAQSLNLGEVGAMTAGNWFRKDGEAVAMMFFNMDRIAASVDPLTRHIKGSVSKIFCSYLVHELTHVQQIIDGRMNQKDGKLIWEGKVWKFKNDGSAEYYNYPWEQEAHMAQFTYQCDGDVKAARKALNKLAKAA